jgi:hypothetical protein
MKDSRKEEGGWVNALAKNELKEKGNLYASMKMKGWQVYKDID